MKIIAQPECYDYQGTCNHCKSEIEAARWELYDFDHVGALGTCPVCSKKILFKKK